MARKKDTTPVIEPDSPVERVGRDRLRWGREMIEWIAAWLFMHWQRCSDIVDSAARPGPIGDGKYQEGVIAHATADMECIARLVAEVPQSWTAQSYATALEHVGRLVWASDDGGRPLTRLGEAIRGKGSVNDGTASSGSGDTLPADAGDASQPDQPA